MRRIGTSLTFRIQRDFWCTPQDRLAISGEFRHDFPDDLNTGFISFTWYFSRGRGYRDFWPGDVDFIDLKRDRIPAGYNNRVSEARFE
jgi:hypothetical protein